MVTTVSFIGVGNMGGALCKAVLKSGVDVNVLLVEKIKEKIEPFLSGNCKESYFEDALKADYVFLGVKPQVFKETFEGSPVNKDSVYVSMAAATSIDKIKSILGEETKIIRIMPNTPVTVGEGVVISSCSENVTEEDKREFLSIMSETGLVEFMDESTIDNLGVLTGCGPAYTFMYIDALAKAVEKLGVSPDVARKYAIAMVKGASAYAESSDKTLEQLRIDVCSPGGTTIEGVKKLIEKDLYSSVEEALTASYERNKVLSK